MYSSLITDGGFQKNDTVYKNIVIDPKELRGHRIASGTAAGYYSTSEPRAFRSIVLASSSAMSPSMMTSMTCAETVAAAFAGSG